MIVWTAAAIAVSAVVVVVLIARSPVIEDDDLPAWADTHCDSDSDDSESPR